MAYQEVNVGTANQGDGDTLRGGGNKINANFSEIYGRFGSGTANASTLEAATSGNILVGNGTKFATTAMSGDATISNTGAVSISKVSLTQGNESGAPSGQSATLAIPRGTEPGTKTDKLYNVNGALYFNGASVGTGSVTGMTGFKVTGDSGGEKDVINGETVSILTGSGLTSVASDQQTVTISLDLTTGLTFEGATANAHETTLAVTDPTADRTITFPDATGTVVLKDSTDVFTNKTFDAAGTGNALSNVSNSHISATAAIAFSKMANLTASRALVSDTNGDVSVSDVTSTEIGYLDGVSSAIQTQLDAKQPTISASARIDAAHIHDGTISNTEFGYLNGVTSNIQTQLDAAGGASNLNGLSDATVASAGAGNILLHDGSDSFDNKVVKSNNLTLAHTAALAIPMGGFTFGPISANGTSAYRYGDYKSDGDHQDNPHLYLLSDMAYIFDLSGLGGSHPFQIQASTSALTASNGADGLIHISPTGVVTTGTSANTKTSGLLIWKVPHFTAASAGTYRYICTSHSSMVGSITIKTLETIT